jgi:hypothetical protein
MRLAVKDALDDSPLFMDIPKTAGWDKRGNPIYYKTPQGLEVLNENLEPTLDDEVGMVAGHFADWAKEAGYIRR